MVEFSFSIFEDRVNKYINIPLTQQQFDALVTFDMNVIGGLAKNPKILNAVNNRVDNNTLEKIWYLYSSPKDPTIHKGLLNRRKDEFEIWKAGDYNRNY